MEEKKEMIVIDAATVDYSNPAIIKTLKETVARGGTDAEVAMFVAQCKATGLNPFKKEIWFIKAGPAVQMMTGINGFYAIANRHPMFDGIEVELVEDAGDIIKAVARVYRKDRSRPSTAEAYMEEYAKPHGNWKTMPRVMLSKCAESMALRKAFPQELNGIYSAEEMPAEEMPAEYAAPRTVVATEKPGKTYCYSTDKIEPEKLEPAVEYLERAGAEYYAGKWFSKKPLPKMAPHEVKTPTQAKAAAAIATAKANGAQKTAMEVDDIPAEWAGSAGSVDVEE